MRKITFFFALMVTMVTTAFAQVASPSFKQTLADITADAVTEYPEGVATAKAAETSGENCTTGVVKSAFQKVKVTMPCAMYYMQKALSQQVL